MAPEAKKYNNIIYIEVTQVCLVYNLKELIVLNILLRCIILFGKLILETPKLSVIDLRKF